MGRITKLVLLTFVFFIAPSAAQADGGYLRTAAPLDDNRGYCLDVAGFGENTRPDEPLRVHTCKYTGDNSDQLFKWVDSESGQVAMPAYDRCLASESLEPGAQILVKPCENSDTQAWTFVPNGNLVLRAKPDLCLTIGDESFDAGAAVLTQPGYAYRTSTMQLCRERGDELQNIRWGRDDEHEHGVANALRNGMPDDFQESIRAIAVSDGSIIGQTNELYADVERVYRASEVETTADIAYGSHERHKLDVHVDTQRRSDSLQPVIVYVHGGGYVRGSKEGSRNVGEYFASIGLVGVSVTYRLAPEVKWPAGANDIGAAMQWINDNIEEYGGDPNKIFLIGKSAGGGHVGTYAFRPEVLEKEYPEAAGIVLVSAGYGADTEAYFGDITDNSKAIFGNISRTSIPVMITASEYDNPGTAQAAIQLAAELATEHDQLPRLKQLAGHNHYSPNISIGTSDRMLSDEILDFVLNAKAN